MAPARPTFAALALVAALALASCGGPESESAPAEAKRDEAAASKQEPAEQALPTDRQSAEAVARFAAKGRPVYCGGTKKPWVALTFDDGPGAYTKKVLTLLNRADVRRTFFVNGKNVAGNRTALLRQKRSGSAIGNHSWSHPLMTSLSASAQREEIVSTSRAVRRVTDEPVTLFRPPYGARDKHTDRIVKRRGMVTILWDVDSEDALGANSKEIARRIKRGLRPGSIILLHENRGQTLRALRYTILPALKKSDMIPVTIPQMLAGNPPSDRQLRRGRDGCRRTA